MKIAGNRTGSIIKRCNIVNDGDLKLAAQKQQEYLASQSTGTNPVKLTNLSIKKSKRATAN
jgi:hypothetical protein